MRNYSLSYIVSRCRTISCFVFLFFIGIICKGQQNKADFLAEQFNRYQGNALQEKLFMHTSKDVFFAGETIFLKVYTVDGMFHRPLNLNRVAYVEMLNDRNEPVAQAKVALKNDGTGNGTLLVPDSLFSANYRIISYTSWMRNFDPDFFCIKGIRIINPLKSLPGPVQTPQTNVVSKFFPEGGNLVYGLQSKVGFQVTTLSGKGLDAHGAILTESNDTLIRFQSLKFGLGSFSFTPEKGHRYRAFIQTSEGSLQSDLPEPYDVGFVMTVNEDISGDVKISVHSNISTSGEVYLFVHNRQRIRKVLPAVPDASRNIVFNIPVQDLDDGISHLTLFDAQLKPVAERLYFKQPKRLLDITVGSVKKSYTKRESVQMSIETSAQGQPQLANLSLSIFRLDDVQRYDSTNIVNFLFLTSDLKGYVENPSYYLSADSGVKRASDNLMLTHGWRRFSWADVMNNNWPVVQFSPDTEGMSVRAIVTDSRNNPKPNANFLLSTQSREIHFFPGRTNSRGVAQFYSRDLYGKCEVVFQQISDSTKFNISLVSPFTTVYPSHPFSRFRPSKNDSDLIRSYSIHKQVQLGFNAPKEKIIAIDSVPFYGTADKSYMLADYVGFPMMLDVFREYVFEIVVRKNDKKYRIFLQDKDTGTFFENEPFVLLDGVPVFDSDRIATLPAQNIKQMDVVNRKFLYGPFVFNGVIVLSTYDTVKYSGVQLNPEAVVFDFEGLQRSQEFYSPAYNLDSKEDRLPDFRNLLLWNPDVSTNDSGKANVSFFTSDLPGRYIGVLNGLSGTGQPGAFTFLFNVE